MIALRIFWLQWRRLMLAADIQSLRESWRDADHFFFEQARKHGLVIDALALAPKSPKRDKMISRHALRRKENEDRRANNIVEFIGELRFLEHESDRMTYEIGQLEAKAERATESKRLVRSVNG